MQKILSLRLKYLSSIIAAASMIVACGAPIDTASLKVPKEHPESHRLEARTLSPHTDENGRPLSLESENFEVTSQTRDSRMAYLSFDFEFTTAPAVDHVKVTLHFVGGSVEEPPTEEFEVTRIDSNDLKLGDFGVFSGVWYGNKPVFTFTIRKTSSFGSFSVRAGEIFGVSIL